MAGAVCAFDIDNTVTCGKQRAKELIGWCRDRGFGLAIVTARPGPFPPHDWVDLGFSAQDIPERLHFNPDSYSQTGEQHGIAKADALEALRLEHGIEDKSCVLLLDDMPYNIREARKRGFSGVRAGGRGACGLDRDAVDEAKSVLSHCVGHAGTINNGGGKQGDGALPPRGHR